MIHLLFLLSKNRTLEDFKKNLSDPLILIDELSDDSLITYSKLDSTSFQWLMNEIDDYLIGAKKSELFIDHFFL
ncbi:MAG: hypothetical protein H6613_03395 [Ignavibacteriales bacterium]|nr:hypothetical protein [Ignavibacteriales bacterium]